MKKKKNRLIKVIAALVFILLGGFFVVRFGWPLLLRGYIQVGIGDCQKIPILCAVPVEQIKDPAVKNEYLGDMVCFRIMLPKGEPGLEINMPKDFTVVKQMVSKGYFKKFKFRGKGSVAYMLYRAPGYFVNLYPQLKTQGIMDDHTFLRRTMYAREGDVQDIVDAFFVIMKTVFTPGLGDWKALKMAQFTSRDKEGFISYNFTPQAHYFDCNMFDSKGDFLKLYIKDKQAKMGLDELFAILSTFKVVERSPRT